MNTNYRDMPLGTRINGGVVDVCPVCKKHGLITKREPQDGLVLIDICHSVMSYLTPDGVLGVMEDEHLSVELENVSDAPPASEPSSRS